MDHAIPRPRRAARCIAALAAASLLGCDKQPAPVNVLLYTVDTLRADSLGCYGNARVATPNIDRLAAEGWLHPDAWANSSWTRSSMASLFTGRYPRRHGVMGRADALPGSFATLGDLLRARGYATAFITANPNVGSVFGFQRGFDEIMELYRRRTKGSVGPAELIARSDEITGRAIEWLGRAQRPFYLAILSVDPHSPYTPPERFDRYGGDYAGSVDGSMRTLDRGSLDAADRRRIRSLYDGEVSFNDDSFGRLIEHLRETGELDDTLVVFTSDHGEEFWEYGRRGHGRSLADPVLRIPLILRLPAARDNPPPAPAAPAELVDVLPTVLDVLDMEVERPDAIDGRSLLSAAPDAGSVWASLHLDGKRLEALRSKRWKLVWDLVSDRFELFELTRPKPEAQPAANGAESARVLQELREELLARLSSGAAAPGGGAPGELPADVEGALRARGYIE